MFNAETYWADKTVKKFVVELADGDEFHNMIVAAKNEARARARALESTFLSAEHAEIKAIRLATPEDLGILTVESISLHDHEADWFQARAEELSLELVEQCNGNGVRHFFLCNKASVVALNQQATAAAAPPMPKAVADAQLFSALKDCVSAMKNVISFSGSDEDFFSALRMAEYLTQEQRKHG